MKEFEYQLLSRLESDCKYFLGNGCRYEKHLYYKNVDEQIQEMKNLYNSFPDDEKPDWISLEAIEELHKKMKTENYVMSTYFKNSVSLTSATVENLKQFKPKGCSFKDYSLLDLLIDFFKMYSWKFDGTLTIPDFIDMLKAENNAKALLYGDGIIRCLVG